MKVITMMAALILLASVSSLATNSNIAPVKGKYINEFGFMEEDKNHQKDELHSGLDIEGLPGSEVVATGSGKVIFAGDHQGELSVFIDHDNGKITRYENLGKLKVTKGQRVSFGQVLGSLKTGGEKPFIHYEVIVNDVVTDPAGFITE